MGNSGCDEILMKEPEVWWIGHKLFNIFYFEEGSRECSHWNGNRGFEKKKKKTWTFSQGDTRSHANFFAEFAV